MSSKNLRVIPISLGLVSVFVIKGENTILVDTGIPGSEEIIAKKMLENGIDPQSLKLIILTHAHEDHFGSAKALKERTGAKIAIQRSEADNLSKGINSEIRPINWKAKLFSFLNSHKNKDMIGVDPDILLDDEYSLEEYGISGKVIATPGHTPGSVSIVLENKQAIVGDLIMAFFPKTLPKYPMFACNMSEVKSSIKKIMSYLPNQVYAGHGGPFSSELIIQKFNL